MTAPFEARGHKLFHYGSPVDYIPSPNASGEMTPRFVVIHYTAGYTAESAINTLTNPAASVSAHVVIDRDGEVTQLVPFDRVAWHAGPSRWRGWNGLNKCSIGIELVNIGFLRRASNGFVDAYGSRRTPASIGATIDAPNARAGSGMFAWQAYPEKQLAAAEGVVRALEAAYLLQELVSHEEIDTRGWKTDPGPAFPMERFRDMVSPSDVDARQVTSRKLNRRTGPGVEFKAEGALSLGENVVVSRVSGDWAMIDEAAGLWVHSGFLRAI